ncbi:MAG: hypothetical protein II544_05920, partial [Spirochaetales bacterium]|nr:hypothetical protein [Spirochaetales bacterium]
MIDERKTMTERMARSAMLKYNTANTKYSYKSAIMLEAMYKASCVLDEPEMFDYVREFLDYFVQEDGSVRTYNLEEYSMDQVR